MLIGEDVDTYAQRILVTVSSEHLLYRMNKIAWQRLRVGQWQEEKCSTKPDHQPNLNCTCLLQPVCVFIVPLALSTGSPSFSFSSLMCCCGILAYSMAEMRISQVGGCFLPWSSLHLTSPACTISSSFRWSLKHALIADVSRPTPSRTALALTAAFLLT